MKLNIPSRFCGPSSSGNGGYSSGRLAGFIDGPAEVTLRAPPPLNTDLKVERTGQGVKLWHDAQLIAEASPSDFTLEVPAPPSWEEAQAASRRYLGLRRHEYPECFVCGPNRKPGDGLCIHCGLWRHGVVAGTWIPDASLTDEPGGVRPEFLWAAIDCPGSWSVIDREDPHAKFPPPSSSMLLGRLAGRLIRSLRMGEECIVIGWPLGQEGRKFHVGSAIYTRPGELVAFSRGTWIALKS